jgi:RND family efflux transporter MFP subunit
MNAKKLCLIIIGIIILLLVIVYIFKRHEPVIPASVTSAVAQNIAVTTLHKKDVNDFYEAVGTIQASTISMISSRIIGTVTDVLVKQGDKVTSGQELLLIDNNDLTQRVIAAQASFDDAIKAQQTTENNKALAEITYNRYKLLYDQKALTGQEMDQITNQKQQAELVFEQAKTAVEAAQANLRQANINLDYARITSPIDGVVTSRKIDKGSMASPGTTLLIVEDTTGYKAQANIDESMTGQIKISMPVEVIVDSISRTFKATINEIVPSIDTSSRSFIVKAIITSDPNRHLLANGQYARVMIPQKKRSILTIPVAAIVRKGQLIGVYVFGQGNSISYRMIRTGKTFGSDVEVISGLSDGEKIITKGINNVSEGQIVN